MHQLVLEQLVNGPEWGETYLDDAEKEEVSNTWQEQFSGDQLKERDWHKELEGEME